MIPLTNLDGYEYGVLEISFPTRYPPGNAEGSSYLRNRGHPEYGEITCWPNYQHHPLYVGGVDPDRNITEVVVSGTRLWNQELSIYLDERRRNVIKALENLHEVKPIPRVGQFRVGQSRMGGKKTRRTNIYSDVKPHPEDFGSEWKKVEKWLRSK
jgi:hypothetical protein